MKNLQCSRRRLIRLAAAVALAAAPGSHAHAEPPEAAAPPGDLERAKAYAKSLYYPDGFAENYCKSFYKEKCASMAKSGEDCRLDKPMGKEEFESLLSDPFGGWSLALPSGATAPQADYGKGLDCRGQMQLEERKLMGSSRRSKENYKWLLEERRKDLERVKGIEPSS